MKKLLLDSKHSNFSLAQSVLFLLHTWVHTHTHKKTHKYMYEIEFLKMYLGFKAVIWQWLTQQKLQYFQWYCLLGSFLQSNALFAVLITSAESPDVFPKQWFWGIFTNYKHILIFISFTYNWLASKPANNSNSDCVATQVGLREKILQESLSTVLVLLALSISRPS